jgi:hypothetical protein
MRTFVCGVLLAAVGCSSDTGGDVKGPFTGDVHRYKVDKLTLPSTTALQNEFAGDLDGDESGDNQLGLIVAAITQTNDTNKHVPDIIASGALASALELQANDLVDDSSVGATYIGKAGADSTVAGGMLEAGSFLSNRTATTKVPGAAHVSLPVFADADPSLLPLVGLEMDLWSDGNGGFDGIVRGGIPIADARTIAYAGVAQMMKTNPSAHLVFARLLDTNQDGAITTPELMASGLLAGFLVDDIAIGDERVLSVGFGIHLCPEGACSTAAPLDPCTDRIKDGAETDVDCGGGTCPTCAADLVCSVPADCQTGGCDAGKCRAPTCSDGFRDGFESDVDCGAACGDCAVGQRCANGDDCASGRCNASTGSSGVCGS